MPKYEKIEGPALDAALEGLDGWSLVDGKLHRAYKFKDFSAAMAFMLRGAMEAHMVDHHPEWANVYNRVTVDLVTHETGGITDLDIELAGRFNRIASQTPGP